MFFTCRIFLHAHIKTCQFLQICFVVMRRNVFKDQCQSMSYHILPSQLFVIFYFSVRAGSAKEVNRFIVVRELYFLTRIGKPCAWQ